jgi:hypothetical protein
MAGALAVESEYAPPTIHQSIPGREWGCQPTGAANKFPAFFLLRERIAPAESREFREVTVCRMELEPVLNGKSGQMGIGGEISSGSGDPEQLEEHLAMIFAGMDW